MLSQTLVQLELLSDYRGQLRPVIIILAFLLAPSLAANYHFMAASNTFPSIHGLFSFTPSDDYISPPSCTLDLQSLSQRGPPMTALRSEIDPPRWRTIS